MKLSDYVNGIEARLLAVQAAGDNPRPAGQAILVGAVVILKADEAELETAIATAIEKNGMLILIGQPSLKNTRQAKMGPAVAVVRSQIAIGEIPTLWRTGAVAAAAAYDNTGTVTYEGLEVGQPYTWTPGANEAQIQSGTGNVLTEAGVFMPELSSAKVTGTASQPFTGKLVPVRPRAMDLAMRVFEILQGFKIGGFLPLVVDTADLTPDKQRQLYQLDLESQIVVQRA